MRSGLLRFQPRAEERENATAAKTAVTAATRPVAGLIATCVLVHEIRELITSPLGQVLLQLAVRPDLGEYEPAREAFWAARLAVAGRVLERAEARGELRPGLDRHVAVETLVAPLSLRMLLTREPLDDAFIETVADLVTGGIRRRR